jgi:hypothetical protein
VGDRKAVSRHDACRAIASKYTVHSFRPLCTMFKVWRRFLWFLMDSDARLSFLYFFLYRTDGHIFSRKGGFLTGHSPII